MAKLNDEQMKEILAAGLVEGESVIACAYGVRQPNMLYMLPAFALAILPGVILTQVLTKHYIVGLSQSRVIVAEVSPKWASLSVAVDAVKSLAFQELSDLAGQPVKTGTGAIFTTIVFPLNGAIFKAKFHRAFSKANRSQAMAIAEAIDKAASA